MSIESLTGGFPRLAGQVAVVTGAASGIGKAIAHSLAAEGAAVMIGDIDEPGAARVADAIEQTGQRAQAVRTDVSRPADADALVTAAVESFGRLDVLVNNAGVCLVKPFLETTCDDLDHMHAVHARGTFACTLAAARAMLPRRYGRIVNVVSGGAVGAGGTDYSTAYQAAKASQGSITRASAIALAPHGITVNAVCPGTVETPLWESIDAGLRAVTGHSAADVLADRAANTAIGRNVEASEVAGVVVFLALPDSSAINGQVIGVCGEPF
jgi:NAD(P)-dependent dehydrogenase (short-subunit alcohol dehydrogenase family)